MINPYSDEANNSLLDELKENKNNKIQVKKLVYISHPSSGLEENTKDIEKIIRKLYSVDEIFNEYCFVSPVHNYGFMYHDVAYDRGLSYCTDLLYFCEEIWVFGDWKNSTGCKAEVELSYKLGIKVRFLGYSSELDSVIKNKTYKSDNYVDTPLMQRDILRNKRLFVCVPSTCLVNKYDVHMAICNRILYENINDAIDKVKGKSKNSRYVLLEVELDANSIIDITDANLLNQFKKELNSTFNEQIALNCSILAVGKSVAKRYIPGNIEMYPGSNIMINGKTVYQVINTEAIKQIKVYNNYILGDNECNRAFTFGSPF